MNESCCSPGRTDGPSATTRSDRTELTPDSPTTGAGTTAAGTTGAGTTAAGHDSSDMARDWLHLGGTSFLMGSDETRYPSDGEGPVRTVTLDAFAIAATAVTNDEWSRFVTATGHRSESERLGSSFVFGGLLPDDFPPTRGVAATPWWRLVEGATWDHPEGPQSGLDGRGDHPVVHVSWSDAVAYCDWSGTRLPNEAEWEYTARGGLEQRRYPWGDELEPDGRHMMNVFQGTFPGHDTAEDGHAGTAPVRAFEPNGHGAYNTCGNVWEWCQDWFDPERSVRVMRGGSYLCHESYCWRYRVAARSANTPDSATGNIGFRVAKG